MTIAIPQIDPDADTLTAALSYAAAGLYVGPVRHTSKSPGSVLGSSWQRLTSTDPQTIASWFAGTDHGIFIHAGRSGLLILDVDAPEKLHPAIRRAVDELAPPYQTSRQGEPERGHYLFEMPPGRMLGNSTGTLGTGWGEVRGHNGVIIVAPSAHEDEAGLYQWQRTGAVPTLPEYVAAELPDAMPTEATATNAQVRAFLEAHTSAERPELVGIHVVGFQKRVELGESRHQSMCGPLAGAMREAAAGLVDARTAADTLEAVFTDAVTKAPTSGKQGKARDPRSARDEWRGLLAWAVPQAKGADPEQTRARVAERVPDVADLVAPSSGVAADSPAVGSSADIGSSVIRDRIKPGGAFIFDQPDRIPAIWGRGNEVLWAEGEALTICGPSGVGKTTLSGQVVRARMVGGHVLDLPVTPTSSTILYLAMDRPRQIARSMRRTLGDLDRAIVDERLQVWQGPPLADVAAHPETLLTLAQEAGADTVVIDSIKDAAIGLSNDEVGAGYNRARQLCIAAGVEVLELHHMVKKGDNGSPPTNLADMYGSAWIGNGSGSVVNLHGEAGDPIVAFKHLKTPADEVGPYKVIHDHDVGQSAIYHQSDLVAVAMAAKGAGITAKQAAQAIGEKNAPSRSDIEKARRRLDKLVDAGRLERGERDVVSGSPTAVWKYVTDPLAPGHDSGHARDRGDSGHEEHARSRTPAETPESRGSAGHDSGHAGHAPSGHAFPHPPRGVGDADPDRWTPFAGGTQEVNTRTKEVRNPSLNNLKEN